ncbi:HDOD domain-containing protein [Bacterioplanoides sp.]|uniref:HDOD domain-containing protein n=1 Tax=Bacterioplanoides sp. TaxID=2066072 RepID=UPI003B597893
MTQLSLVPPSATSWKAVKEFRDFPILAESRDRVRKQMRSNQVNFDDLSKVVEQDPALCLHLLMSAVSQNPDCREQISGAASCLSLLGMQELVRLIKQLPVVTANSESRQHQLYRRALHCSGMAGELAAQWAASKGSSSVSYARWSTMLTAAPMWLWLLNDELSQNWLYSLSQGQDLIPAANSCFGTQHLKDWQQLAKLLCLPQLAIDCYRPQNWLKQSQWQLLRKHDPRDLDDQRKLLHQMQEPHMIAIMANSFAWHWHISPLGKRSKRWLSLVCHWLGKPEAMQLAELRKIQLMISRSQQDALSSGLALLLSPELTAFDYPKIVPQKPDPKPERGSDENAVAKAVPTPEPEQQTRQPDSGYLKKLMQQLQQQPDSFGDWHYLMRGVLKGICQGVGLSSACIALLNKDKTVLKVFYAEGVAEQDLIRRLAIDLRKTNIFGKLLEKPASLLITSENRARFMRGLPEQTQQRLPEQLVTMSIDAGNKPIGVVIAYNEDGKESLTPAEYMAFKNLCQTASSSLAELRSNTEKQRKSRTVGGR